MSSAPAPGKHDAELMRLLSALCDDSITDPEIEKLESILRADPAARTLYRRYTDMAAELQVRAPEATQPAVAKPIPIYRKGCEPKPQSAIGNRQSAIYASLAAALLVACGIGIYIFVSSLPHSELPDPASTAPLANLIENASEGTLTTPGGFISEGRDYPRGEYALSSGTAEFMLTNAVNVKLRGETRLSMHTDMSVSLTRGSAEFLVPTDATGFTVHLPGGSKVVDLGTRFVVRIDKDGAARVGVLEGEVRIDYGQGVSSLLTTDQSVRLAGDELTPIDLPAIATMNGAITASGDGRVIDPPASVEPGALVDAERLAIFAERRGIPIPAKRPIGIGRTGRETAQTIARAAKTASLNEPTRVDSYLVHFDPQTQADQGPTERTATFTFGRPIVSVIPTRGLNHTDAIYGSAATTYGGAGSRGIDQASREPMDAFTISEDRLSITVEFVTPRGDFDQIRILVEADPDAK